MADQRPWMVRWMVRSADLRRCAFGLEKACSIGLKACPRLDQGSGLQGGRKRSVAPAASIRSRATGPLWLDRLSMITTSPGFGSGTRTWLTQARKGRGRGEEGVAVHRAPSPAAPTIRFAGRRREPPRARDHAGAAYEACRLPVSKRHARAQPLAPAATAVVARHVGRGPGLVDEDRLVGVEGRAGCRTKPSAALRCRKSTRGIRAGLLRPARSLDQKTTPVCILIDAKRPKTALRGRFACADAFFASVNAGGWPRRRGPITNDK